MLNQQQAIQLINEAQSLEIDKWAVAVGRLHAEISDIEKDTMGHQWSYSKVDKVYKHCRHILPKYELTLSLFPFVNHADGSAGVSITLVHSSGQWKYGKLAHSILQENKKMNNVQREGATITYAKRTAVLTVLGFNQVDEVDADDSAPTIVREVTPIVQPKLPPEYATAYARIKQMNIPASDVIYMLDRHGVRKLTELPINLIEEFLQDLSARIQSCG